MNGIRGEFQELLSREEATKAHPAIAHEAKAFAENRKERATESSIEGEQLEHQTQIAGDKAKEFLSKAKSAAAIAARASGNG